MAGVLGAKIRTVRKRRIILPHAPHQGGKGEGMNKHILEAFFLFFVVFFCGAAFGAGLALHEPEFGLLGGTGIMLVLSVALEPVRQVLAAQIFSARKFRAVMEADQGLTQLRDQLSEFEKEIFSNKYLSSKDYWNLENWAKLTRK
ncbi:hypothetical protein D6827_02630, partial [Candidatus Parcubacteria bacterium]